MLVEGDLGRLVYVVEAVGGLVVDQDTGVGYKGDCVALFAAQAVVVPVGG